MFLYLGIALLAGLLLANQSPINADLRKIVGSPFLAAAISFLIGTIVLALLSLTSSGQIFPSLTFISHEPLWIWIGGLLGAIYLTSNVLLFPRLGAVQTVILPILGSILMGTVIDTFGYFGTKQIPLTSMRLLGILVMVAGLIIAVVLPNYFSARREMGRARPKDSAQSGLLLWRLWGILCGGLSAMQQAINGQLGVQLHNSPQASFISFFIGFIMIALVAAIVDKRPPRLSDLKNSKIWHWFGGVLGGLFVLTTVISVPKIGAGLTIMMGLTGQILGSILVQQFGFWRSPKYRTNLLQIIGVLVMLLGIVVIKFL